MTTSDAVTAVALFARIPVQGRVKTRLAKELGSHEACELYKAIVADVLHGIKTSGLPLILFCDGKNDGNLPQKWIDASDQVVVQHGASLGERMVAAFEYCFNNQIDQVILVGSDVPGINAELLLTAAKALKKSDVAIAPATDGGYCLIAIKRNAFLPVVFEDILWSTDTVLRDTLEKCGGFQMDVELLDILPDIDTIDDLKAYRLNPSATAHETNVWIENAEV